MGKVIPASFSSIESYNTCPFKHFKTRVEKTYKEDQGEAMIWGNNVHKALEDRAKMGTPVPSTMTRFQPITDKIVASTGKTLVEMELAVTVDLKPTGWWDNDAWYRGKIDIAKVNEELWKAAAFDYKTGKVKENSRQMSAMGMLMLIHYPKLDAVNTAFLWISTRPDKPTFGKVVREDIPEIVQGLKDDIGNMEWSVENNVWPKKPSGLCKGWCPVKECEYYGKGGRR